MRLSARAYLDMRGGINCAFDRTELLDGWVYETPADGPLTRLWNRTLAKWLIKSVGADVAVVSHQTLPLGGNWAPSPDHYLFPEAVGDEGVSGPDVLLVIEVSDATLAYDLGGKANAYAAHGVREYWVIDPKARKLYAHRLSAGGSYGEPLEAGFGDRVEAILVPNLALRLADLPRIG